MYDGNENETYFVNCKSDFNPEKEITLKKIISNDFTHIHHIFMTTVILDDLCQGSVFIYYSF